MKPSFVAALPALLRTACLAAGLAVPLATTFAPPAQAQGHGQGWGEERRERQRHEQRERYWDDRGRHEGYYRRPELYYSAPPVVVHHPDYYQRPSPGISFQLPYFYR